MKNLRKRTFCCISILFAALIFIQHQYIFMYQDDYGYASLTYGIIENEVGMSFSLIDIFKYLVWHYFNWGGRVLYFFFQIAIFRVGGLKLMQIVQSVIIVLICIISGKIIAYLKKVDMNTSIMLTLVFYGLFHQTTLMDGVYWYSASVLYVWPLLPFLGAIYIFITLNEKETRFKKCVFILLIFFAAFSQEQIAVFVLTWIVCILFLKKINRERILWNIRGGGIFAALGCVFILLAPGNFVRANGERYSEFYSKSIMKRFLDNLYSIIDINIGSYNWIFIIILSIFLGVAVAVYAKKKWMYIASCIFSVYFILEQMISIPDEFKVFLRFIWIVYFFSILFWHYNKQKNYVFLSLLISGILSQGMMIVSPVIPLRSHTMMEFILHILLVECIISIYNNLDLKRLEKTLYIICVTMVCLYSTYNLKVTLTGYKNNYEINQINHYKLVEAHKKYLSGCKLSDVVLYKLSDDRYAHDMPYHSNAKYIEEWMKNYYELPDELVFNWFDISKDYVFEFVDGEYYDDHWMGKEATFRIQTYEEYILNLSITNPDNIKNQQIRCEIAGNEYTFDIMAGEKKNVDLVVPSGENNLLIQSTETFIPSNGDTRELSVILESAR